MDKAPTKTLHYKRSHFATQLPMDYLYSPSHAWLAAAGEGRWRVGLTKFASRMLGEMVDHGFEVISDLFCVAAGEFTGSNPALKERISLITRDPYGSGWLYEVNGTPDTK